MPKKKVAPREAVLSPPRLGAMSNLFRGTPEQVVAFFLDYGLESVQLLPMFLDLRLASAADVTTTHCAAMSAPFLGAALHIAAVTAHTNFLDPDRPRRREMVKRFDALIDHCHDFGTHYLVTESGTLNPEHPWNDFTENHTAAALSALIKALAPSVKLAEKAGVVILIEGHRHHLVGTLEQARQVRETLGESIGFVMDPVNYFTRTMVGSSKRFLQQIFEALGDAAPVAHAKDVRVSGTSVATPRAGNGNLDYPTFLELLDRYQPNCPLILEQIQAHELRETIEFIDQFLDS